MGAYSPLDWAPASLVDELVSRVAQPTVDEMARRGTPFSGVLYIGVAVTSRGPRVIEFNARFGDPETQVVLARLKTPLGGLLKAAALGELDRVSSLHRSDQHAVTVVVASHNYPGTPRTGDPVMGIEDASEVPTAYVLHAGTARADDGTLVSAGGRVVSVVALGESLSQARERVYEAVGRIELEGSHHRTDIALAAEREELHVG
jgi:phosphoribosylamine--glycine ligase